MQVHNYFNILIALFDFLGGRRVLYNKVQWSPVNLVTNRPQKYGCINRVAVLMGLFE